MDKDIKLGSGKLYVLEYDGTTIPTDAILEVEENLIGLISGGAIVEYKPSFYEAKDDLGLVSKTVLTDEEVMIKSGTMTWNGDTLKKLCPTARVTEDVVLGKRTVKIGGVSMQDSKLYIVHFVHKNAVDGDVRATIIGNNQAGFNFQFMKDKETIVDMEFKATPMDNEGTKVIYKEDIPVVGV